MFEPSSKVFPQNLIDLSEAIAESWKSINIGQFNGNSVRFRVMEDVTANWHTHDNSDELFYVVSEAMAQGAMAI